MKTAFYRFCSKYRTIAKILLGLFLCGTYSFLLWLVHAPIWLHAILWALLLLITFVAVDNYRNKLLIPTMKTLDDACDPYPLLSELELQASYPASESMSLLHRINHATALRATGDFDTALRILKEINIDKSPSTVNGIKFIYYNNLADLHHLTGQYDEADVWNEKARQIWRDLPENKQKKLLEVNVHAAAAEAAYRKGEYAQTMVLLDQITFPTLRGQVETALLYARCALQTGDTETTKAKLQFVLQNGNRLFCVDEARKLLANLYSQA